MAQGHLDNEEFFIQLASLIDKTQQKGHGSVYLTQKRRMRPLSAHAFPRLLTFIQ